MLVIVAFDTETELTRPGCKAPPLVCLTWQFSGQDSPNILHGRDPAAKATFLGWLSNPDVTMVGHFVAYDMTVCAAAWPDLLPLIFAKYEADQVTDTMLREKLFDIEVGHYRGYADERGVWRKNDYNLDGVARRRAGMKLRKDGWRLRYAEFLNIPVSGWAAKAVELMADAQQALDAGLVDKDLTAIVEGTPEDVIRYPLEDARATLAVYEGQARSGSAFADEYRQACASFWLTLMSAWGMRTHGPGVVTLKVLTGKEISKLESGLVEAGLIRKDGSRDTKKATARMLEVMGWVSYPDPASKSHFTYEKFRPDARPLRKTAGGGISLDRDACKASDDLLLTNYGEVAQLKAVLSKDVPMLEAGTQLPVHSRFDMASSGRTTSSSPNIQNLRRLPGIREAFVPRPGMVFAQADYPGLELRTLAQVCIDLFGQSELARLLNEGNDPHLAVASKILGISYAEAKANKKRKDVDNARQIGKVANFGFPGGLGFEKLCLFAKKTYDVTIAPEEAKALKRTWQETFPEMRAFFAHVGQLCDGPDGEGSVVQLRSFRVRGGSTYTAACNTYFQGLGADATKAAGFAISKACYVDKASPLFGSRIANYVHDEFLVETPLANGHEAAHELSRIMREEANRWLPDVPFKAPDPEPLLMSVWSKDAIAIHDVNGRLVPWTPTTMKAT